jgi:hypothetical protein
MLNGMAEPDVPDYSWLSDPVRRPEAMCIAPQAGARLVFGSAGAAIAVTWLGSGQAQRRLTRRRCAAPGLVR